MTGKESDNESTVTVYAVLYYANIGLLRPMRGERPIVNLLGGIKVGTNKNLLLSFAVQVPIIIR